VIAFLMVLAFIRDRGRQGDVRLDWTGFLALSVAITCLQLMMDRGERLDWFESTEIVIEAIIMVAGLYFFVAHSLTSHNPIVDLRLLRNRNYALGMIVVFLYGVLTLAPMVLMPPFLQDLQDYPMTTIGLLLSPRGVGLFMAMIILGRLGSRIDPRVQIASGFVLLAVSSWWMSRWNLEIDAAAVIWTGLMQGLGAGSIIGPLGLLTFASLPARHRTEAASMWNLIRSVGSSIGIAVALAVLVRTAGISRGVLVEAISPYNEILRTQPLPGGGDLGELSSLLALDAEVARQALMIGYVDVFYLCAITSILALPLIPLLARPRRAK
jgi:DHA2 family multidrug resistance protein